MKPGVIYRISFKNVNGDIVQIEISDTTVQIDDSAEPDITSLKPGGSPLRIVTDNSDEDKFFQVRSKRAIISFKSDGWQDIQTFCDGPDYRFKVDIKLNPDTDNETIFLGFIVSSELEQPLLSTPFIVTLVASDRLSTLKDIEFTNDDGDSVRGRFKFSYFLSTIFKKTGLSLPIKVINNIRHGTGQTTLLSSFIASSKTIIVPVTGFFYVGQTFRVANTVDNDGIYTVTAVGQSIITLVGTAETLNDETDVNATFTDQTSMDHFYEAVYMGTITLEKEVGEAEDCYTGLEKILGEYCFCCQYKGEWWICSVDEYDGNPFYIASFDENGVYQSISGATTLPQQIGKDAAATYGRFINADQLVRRNRPHGIVKETFRYETAKEAVCNMAFIRGDVITAPDLAAPESTGDYVLDCWRLRKTSGTITSTKYTQRTFKFGAEDQRYAVITPQSGSATPYDFIESEGIDMELNDKGSFGFSFRFANEISGSGFYSYFLVKIYLKGDDGNWYYWWSTDDLDDPSTYRWTVSAIETDRAVATTWNLGDIDEREWRSVTVEFGPLPVAGKLYIGLYQGKQGGHSSDNQNIYYTGLSFTYKAFINNSYELFKGHTNRVDRVEAGYLALRERQVYIGDSPRREFKGAMYLLTRGDEIFTGTVSFGSLGQFEMTGDLRSTFLAGMQIIVTNSVSNNITGQITSVNYVIVGNTTTVFTDQATTTELSVSVTIYEQRFTLTKLFYSAAVFALAYATSYVNCHPYGYLQVFTVWNQLRNAITKVTGSAKWIAGTNWPDLIHKYELTAPDGNVANRYFIVISFEQDWKTNQATVGLIEIYKTDGKNYDDTFTFKYITGNE